MSKTLLVCACALAFLGSCVFAQDGDTEAPAPAKAKLVTNAGNDFVPGTRVIFATDFSREQLGGFPRGFELKAGNMEVAEVGGKRALRITSSGQFSIVLPEVLPNRFTMEFDLIGSGSWYQDLIFAEDEDPYYVTLRPEEDGGLGGPDGFRVVAAAASPAAEGTFAHVRIMADGSFVKVYMNGTRVANAPNARIGRSKQIVFRITADTDAPAIFANFRIAAGGKDLYHALMDENRVTAEGILFDTNSDRIRPESVPVLKELASVLAAHADMRVAVEGHTDNSGNDSDNQKLSEKRAAAVRNWLAANGVSAARVESRGLGSSRPVASNETATGRQANRRVELVRL